MPIDPSIILQGTGSALNGVAGIWNAATTIQQKKLDLENLKQQALLEKDQILQKQLLAAIELKQAEVESEEKTKRNANIVRVFIIAIISAFAILMTIIGLKFFRTQNEK